MDAAKPLCRWLLAAGMAALVGCASNGVTGGVSARGQMPPDPPLPPVRPVAPPGPGVPIVGNPISPVSPTSPISAQPNPGNPGIQTTNYSTVPTVTPNPELL